MTNQNHPAAIDIRGEIRPEYQSILTPDAIDFLAGLAREFTARRDDLLEAREKRQADIDAGNLPDFLRETAAIRDDRTWRVAPVPPDLQDRRVEITGPTERKMVINALNCGARVFMADFEDANSPTWDNMLEGQVNLRDAVNRSITFTNPDGRFYQLNDETATLLVRPRGWHLDESQFLVDGAIRFPADYSTSVSISFTMSGQPWSATPVPISTCPSWKATWKRAFGTTSSSTRKTPSASRVARSKRPC